MCLHHPGRRCNHRINVSESLCHPLHEFTSLVLVSSVNALDDCVEWGTKDSKEARCQGFSNKDYTPVSAANTRARVIDNRFWYRQSPISLPQLLIQTSKIPITSSSLKIRTPVIKMLSSLFTVALTASAVFVAPATCAQENTVVEHEMETTLQADQKVRDYWTLDRIASIDHDPYGTEPFPVIPKDEKFNGAPFYGHGAVPRTVGRLLYTGPYNGTWRDSSCTATLIQSANNATIVTAAHCLKPNPTISHDTAWHINVLFIPGFHDNRPQVNFTLNRALLPSGWTDGPGDSEHSYYNDRAFAVLNLNRPDEKAARADLGPGQHIQFEKNATAFEMTYNLGYPRYVVVSEEKLRFGTPAFTGRQLAACFGKEVDWWRFPSNLAGYPCLMGGGSSGGPHLADFDLATGLGTVVGVNSITDLDRINGTVTLELASSVNDDFAKMLFDAAQSVEASLA